MAEPLLVVENLVVGYGATAVLNGLSLTAATGEVVAVRGPNGCGKSTLLKAVAGVVPISAGDIKIAGSSVRGRSVDEIARTLRVAYLRQELRGLPDLTVRDNLTLASWRAGSLRRAEGRAQALLEMDQYRRLTLLTGSRVSSLSGGERLLVSLALVELSEARLILLDEPFAGADSSAGETALLTMERWTAEGRCLVAVEHVHFASIPIREVTLLNTNNRASDSLEYFT